MFARFPRFGQRSAMTRATVFIVLLQLYGVYTLNPFQPGNHSVVRTSPPARDIDVDGIHCEVWAPQEPGLYPTVAFASAFGLNTPVHVYNGLFQRLASHGVVVAGFSKLNNPNYPHLALDFAEAVKWMETNLTAAMKSHGIMSTADVQHR